MDMHRQPRPLALVTGASSGIGEEIAQLLAERGHDLFLPARRDDRLHALGDALFARYGAAMHCLHADLADPAAPERIVAELQRRGLVVDVLVNDAGFGMYGDFTTMPWQEVQGMVHVNVLALMHLTQLLLPGMLERKKGRILNVGSVAAYLPGPGMAVYHATKTFVVSFSEALWQETRDSGVTVTVLNPGRTKTEFFEHARLRGLNPRGMMDAAVVARIGLHAMQSGKRVVHAGFANALSVWLLRWVPHRPLLTVISRLNGRTTKISSSTNTKGKT